MSSESKSTKIGHSFSDDLQAILVGALIAALGIYLLQSSHVVTGGSAGLTLLLSQKLNWNFSIAYPLISVPFMALALWRRGLRFTVKSLLTIGTLSVFNFFMPYLLNFSSIQSWFGAILGNILLGVSMLIMFRHGTSLGGFNVLALIAQDKFRWKAGYVQMVLDAAVVLGFALTDLSWSAVWAIIGAVVLNFVLATNHRPDRYIAG
ncbi:MAG: YitT family protein [Micrococcales bacterium]